MTQSRPGRDDQWDDDAEEVLGADAPPREAARKEVSRRDAESRNTAQTAANLFIAGWDYPTIAEKCDYTTPQAARAAVEKVLADAYSNEDRVAARNGMAAQLDAMIRSLAPRALHSKMKVTDERTGEVRIVNNDLHIPYVAAFSKVLDQKAKLLGLNAPQVLAMVDPTAEQFQDTIRQIAAQEGMDVAEDVDIFTLEEGDDGVYREQGDDDGRA